MGLRLKEELKSLCCNNGWSYGVFWRVNRRNSMLVTLEDAYCEEQIRMVIEKMLQQVHMLGEGIIGQAAFTGKHQWLFSDTYSGEWSPTGSVDNQDVFQDNSEFHHQFSSGIKTIAVISVAPQGVVQLGSTQKILETSEFVDRTQSLFRQMESVDGLILSGHAQTDLNSEIYDPSGSFASVLLSENTNSNYRNIKPLHDDSFKELMGQGHSEILTQSSPITSELHRGSMAPSISNSFHLKNQCQIAGGGVQVILSTSSMQLSQVLSQFSNYSNKTVARHPTMSTQSSEGSTRTSIEQRLLSGMGTRISSDISSANLNTPLSFRNTFVNFQGDSTFTPSYSMGGSVDMITNTGLLEANKPIGYDSGKWVDIQKSTPSMHPNGSELLKGPTSFPTFPGESRSSNATTALSKPNPAYNLSQLVASSLEQGNNGLAAGTPNDTPVSFRDTFMNFQGGSTFTPSYSIGGSFDRTTDTGLLEANKHIGYGSGKQVNIQQSTPLPYPTEGELAKGSTGFPTFPEECRPFNATTGLSKPNPVNNLSQLVAPQLEQGNNGLAAATLNSNLSQALGVVSVSSGFIGGDVFSSISNNATNSLQNPIINSISPFGVVCDGKRNPSHENDLFDNLGLDFDCGKGRECWDDSIMPQGTGSRLSVSTGISECISELDVRSLTGPQKGFFSDFGIEQLLDDVVGNSNSVTKPSSEDSTTTITRTGSTSGYRNQIPLAGLSCLGGSIDRMFPEYNLEKMNMLGTQKEIVTKSQVSSWIDDSYSINAESAVVSQPKRPDEQAKVNRKRARPGESTRPRPKDRQQIQDRVKELREIVPNGAKCSIDALLDRTIKHMLFLQSVTKYADKLKQADEPKMIGDENGVVLKDNSSGAGGATWAFEVGGQTMVCPILVEDLSPPGQMLVEMLCEERGFFLEIADIIRGFGLTILKGIMEAREDKIWARFVVEANRDITRMDIFLSLVQLLQQTATSGIGSSNRPNKVIDSRGPLFTNYRQSPTPLPISLADRMQ